MEKSTKDGLRHCCLMLESHCSNLHEPFLSLSYSKTGQKTSGVSITCELGVNEESQVSPVCILQHHSSKASMFLALSFLYSPILTSIHDHWKNHSLD